MEDVGKDMDFEEIRSIWPNGITLGVQDCETGVKVEEI